MWKNTPEELAQFAEEKRTQVRRDFFRNLLEEIHEINQTKKNIDVVEYATTVLTQTEISSVSGGSCWNEDDHYENSVSGKILQNELHKRFCYKFKPLIEDLGIPVIELEKWLTEKLNNVYHYNYIKQYVEREYYGNSTTYGIYGLKIEDVVEKFCDEETKEIYQNELKMFQETPNEKFNLKNKYKSKY